MAKGKKNRSHTAGKSKDEFERKRDERARRNALKKEREVKEYLENDDNFVSFSNQLQAVGYKIKDIKGDGNCLFRALADQLEGDDSGHLRIRKTITRYLQDHREEFEPFVEDNKSFDAHVQELSKLGTFGGNESIVAFSRKHGVNIVIHQLNEPCWVIQGRQYAQPKSSVKDLHISYHNGDHYSSVRRIGDPDNGPAWEYNNRQTKVKDNNDLCKVNEKRKTKAIEQDVSCEGAEASTHSSDIAIVKAATGCKDCGLITQTLIDTNYDMDSTISYVLQVQSVIDMNQETVSLQSSPTSSFEKLNDEAGNTKQLSNNKDSNESQFTSQETRLSPLPVNDLNTLKKSQPSSNTSKGARPKVKQQPHLSNSKRKQLAKQEKKVRRMEERREEAQRSYQAQHDQVEQNLEITGDLEALAI